MYERRPCIDIVLTPEQLSIDVHIQANVLPQYFLARSRDTSACSQTVLLHVVFNHYMVFQWDNFKLTTLT
jgi:hypothetical protein